MFRPCLTMAAVALMSTCAFAQPGVHRLGPRPGDFSLVRGEFGAANKVVLSAPYSAKATTQFTQTLADGNHIQRTTTASIVRDSQGRTRTERSLGSIGRLSSSSGTAPMVFIYDPVAGMSRVLDPNRRTVREMPIHTPPSAELRGRQRNLTSLKTEDLGTQIVQGIAAQGTRATRTIPAGQDGNDRAIDIVTETWYSADLQVVVMSKTSDPRFGETLYQLTNMSRAEPDPALFTVPSDYTVQQERQMRRGPGPVQ
jgi:hypothetical protein